MVSFIFTFLKCDSAQKMKETSKQWRNVEIYGDIFPNECKMTVFRNLDTGKIIWEATKFDKSRVCESKIPDQETLARYLRVAKWNDVFVWFAENRTTLIANKSKIGPFLKKLMLATAENVPVTITAKYGCFPLMLAAAIDDTDSILALIKKGADVHQQNDFGATALHIAAYYGSLNSCETLLENKANIDAVNIIGGTPLMRAAFHGKENVFKFLIEKGANKNLTNNNGKTALQLARF